MRVTIEIECENAAFEDDAIGEAARILEGAARRMRCRTDFPMPLLDWNGNKVGAVTVSE